MDTCFKTLYWKFMKCHYHILFYRIQLRVGYTSDLEYMTASQRFTIQSSDRPILPGVHCPVARQVIRGGSAPPCDNVPARE